MNTISTVHPAHTPIRMHNATVRQNIQKHSETRKEIATTSGDKTVTMFHVSMLITIVIVAFVIFKVVIITSLIILQLISKEFKKTMEEYDKENNIQKNTNVFRSGNFRNTNSFSKINETNIPSVESFGAGMLTGLIYSTSFIDENKKMPDFKI